MHRQSLHLAALAAAAVPGLTPVSVVASPDDPADFSAAVVVDAQRQWWRVRSPRTPEAGIRLETELQVLAALTPRVRAALPFRTPSVAGAVRLGGLRTFVYQDMPGRPLPLEDLVVLGEPAVQDVGRVIAAVHTLPSSVVDLADLPVYTAEEVRNRRLHELDQAATTGRIPPVLLRRWEEAMEEEALWSFSPVPVHGDLHEDNLLVERGRVVGVTGWTDLHVGDPAVDLAWLAAAEDPDFAERVLDAYRGRRADAGAGDDGDEHLMRRASLLAEFALAQWLVRGVDRHDADMIAEAEDMLAELADAVRGRTHGSAPEHADGEAADGEPAGDAMDADDEDADGDDAGREREPDEADDQTAALTVVPAPGREADRAAARGARRAQSPGDGITGGSAPR
ncbi:macrolide 2'-phosphotransferase [uncultured Micrococcus sp.]|uniref:macrolide 2'-phosphotransferase n=1 Tax=uncultured Micrococcus sp. TaxID=114051 RepID=UPI0026102A39|nr:macrolide 2'-phosphotransferase [uncultured Micrococcus sp.]